MQFNLNVTPATFLNFGGTGKKEIMEFHICVGISFKSSTQVVSNLGQERLVPTFIHMMLQCALRCCATCIGTVFDKF